MSLNLLLSWASAEVAARRVLVSRSSSRVLIALAAEAPRVAAELSREVERMIGLLGRRGVGVGASVARRALGRSSASVLDADVAGLPDGPAGSTVPRANSDGSDADTLERFSADIRLLHARAGSRARVAIARDTGLSKTTVSDALRGKYLPSERTLELLADEFGIDANLLLERRRDLIVARAARGDLVGQSGADSIGTVGIAGVRPSPSPGGEVGVGALPSPGGVARSERSFGLLALMLSCLASGGAATTATAIVILVSRP